MALRQRWIYSVLILLLLWADGCQDDSGSGETPVPTITATATAEPTATSAAAEPTVTPTAAPTIVPPTETPTPLPEAAERARERLAEALAVDIAAVEIGAAEPVTWSDGCLGTATGSDVCTAAEVPGYRISLQVGDDLYVYHTDESAELAYLGSAPSIAVTDPLLIWQSPPEAACRAAIFGGRQVAVGFCDGPQLLVDYATDPDRELLVNFAAAFASFAAETPAGSLTFNGSGGAAATPAEQRQLGEWALLTAADPGTRESGTAVEWRREGGIAGFCDLLVVTTFGRLELGDCRGANAVTVAEGALDVDQLAQLYTWLDEYAAFEVVESDDATADGLTETLNFAGNGGETADDTIRAAISTLAAELYAQLVPDEPVEQEGDAAYVAPEGWSRVLIAELGLSFETPANWPVAADDWTWYANGAETMSVGVTWRPAAEVADGPAPFFPEGYTTAGEQPVTLGWGDGVRYELNGPEGAAALHVLVPDESQDLVYDFYAAAPSVADLDRLTPVLSRLVAAVAITDREQEVSGPVQVTVEFLASWLRAPDGSESGAYLTERLQADLAAGQSLEQKLGIPAGYQSFRASWLSSGSDSSRIQADLTYDDGPRVVIFTLLLVDEQWLIDGAAPG